MLSRLPKHASQAAGRDVQRPRCAQAMHGRHLPCPCRKRGKALMRRYAGEQVAVMELDQREDGGDLQDELLQTTVRGV